MREGLLGGFNASDDVTTSVDLFPLGVFGENIVSKRQQAVNIENKYKIDPANIDELETYAATGGSVGTGSSNMFQCQTGTSVGGYGVIRSKEAAIYHAGYGVECLVTSTFTAGIASSIQFAGLFSLTETVAVGYDGASFSCLHSYAGAAEIQTIEVTTVAGGAETATVTLDGDEVAIAITASDTDTNARELTNGLVGDGTLSGKWRFEQVASKVYCIAKAVGDKTGTMSFSTTGSAVATITQDRVGVAKTDNHVPQADWNITSTPFNDFDPIKLNLYRITFGYLGAGNITYGIYNPNTGRFVQVHRIKWASEYSTPNLGHPDLKVGWTAASLGSSGTNLTVSGGSGGIFFEGSTPLHGNTHATNNTKESITTTDTNLLTIRNRVVFGDHFNRGDIVILHISVSNEHNKAIIISIIKNAIVAGTLNFNYIDEFNSIALVDTGGTTISNGTVIDSFTIGANESITVDLISSRILLFPEEEFSIVARTVLGTSTSISTTVTWRDNY